MSDQAEVYEAEPAEAADAYEAEAENEEAPGAAPEAAPEAAAPEAAAPEAAAPEAAEASEGPQKSDEPATEGEPAPPAGGQGEEGSEDVAESGSKGSGKGSRSSKQSLRSARGSQASGDAVSTGGGIPSGTGEEGESEGREGPDMHGEFMEMPYDELCEMGYNFMEPVEKRILTVGQCFMDFILFCDKYTPENTEQTANESSWQRGGNASNVATVLRLLDTPVEFFGVLSNSYSFGCLLEDFRERAIYIHHCPRSALEPAMENVLLSQTTGSHTIIRSKTDMPHLTFEQFKALGDLSQFLWIHFEGYNIEETFKMMKYVRSYNEEHEQKIKVSLSLEIHNRDVLRLAQFADYNILGNQLARFLGWNEPEVACKKFRSFLEKFEAETCWVSVIIVPWSEQGACFMDVDDSIYMMPAYTPIGINDTMGIGDVFIGAFIHAVHVQNKVVRDAVDFANYVCSYKIAHRGFDVIKDIPRDKPII